MTRARRSAGFTLLETIIAMGVLAVGATTALALLVSAAATGRRAEHFVSAAVVADSVFAELEGELNGGFSLQQAALEAVAAADRSSDPGDGPMRAAPFVDPKAQPAWAGGKVAPSRGGSPSSGGASAPIAPPKGNAGANVRQGPPRAFTDDPFATAKTYSWKKDQVLAGWPDYKYDVTITPIGGPPDDPWEFLVEVTIRWAEKGQARDRVFATVLLKKIQHLDNEAPPQ